jgi:hypothetical protein
MEYPRGRPQGLLSWSGGERQQPCTFEELARRVGQYRWVEMRLFEVVGAWVPSVPELDVKVRLSACSYKHAGHADLWRTHFPLLAGMDVELLTVPANDHVASVMDALATPGPSGATVERLAGLYRVVLPHVIAIYRHHLDSASPATDGPILRCLRLILSDEIEDWQEGEMMLRSLIRTPEEVDRATAHQAELEKLLLVADSIIGKFVAFDATTVQE